MLFSMKKEQTYSISEFMNRGKVEEVKVIMDRKTKRYLEKVSGKKFRVASTMVIAGITFATTGMVPLMSIVAMAAGSITPTPASVEVIGNPINAGIEAGANAVVSGIQTKIIHAFEPLMGLIIALSYPVAAVMISAGCLMMMIDKKDKGLQMIQSAGIGYIMVQMSPLFMKLLAEIAKMA